MPQQSTGDMTHVIRRFCTYGEMVSYKPYGNGHINRSFLVTCRQGDKITRYMLQAINTFVFPNARHLMDNIIRVTDYLRQKEGIQDPRRILQVITTHEGDVMYKDFSDTYWRMYTFVDDALSLEQPRMTKDFYEAGYAFGHFQRNLEDFPAETLYPVIPDFHNTPKRYEALCKAVKEDPLGRVPEVKEELAFLAARKDFYGVLNGAHIKGDLPLRVTHNDTKLNNVLLDESTGKALCVLDLDTIMPGFSVTDFGDAIRFGASTAAEDEEDLAKVSLDLDMYQAFSKGYLAGCDGRLTNAETELMPEGAKMMMLECGMRFLTDYILGDVYFKTDYPGHNLVRCRTQLKLAQDTEQKWDILKQMNQ